MSQNKMAILLFEAILVAISTGTNENDKVILKNIQSLIELESEEKEFIVNSITDCLADEESWKQHPLRNRMLISIIQQLSYQEKTIIMLRQEMKFSETFSEKIDAFWKTNYELFFSNDPELSMKSNEDFIYLVQLLDKSIPVQPKTKINNDKVDVLIVVHQFLEGNHAPTLEVKDYAKILISLGRKVEILVTNEMLGRADKEWHFRYNCNGDLLGKHLIDIDGLKVPLYGIKQDQSIENILSIVKYYTQKNPNIIISVGSYSIYSEILGKYSKLITIPTTGGFTFSKYSDIIIWFSGDENKVSDIKNSYQIPDVNIITDIKYQYIRPTIRNPVLRSDLKINAEHKIGVVVGNRLDWDMDDEFLFFIKTLLDSKLITIIFVGKISTGKKEYIEGMCGSAVAFIEFHSNLIDLYGAVDFFLNPKRVGGGTTAAHALAAGILVFSLRYGDVGNISIPECTFDSYKDLMAILIILNDDLQLHDLKQKSRLKFEELVDRTALISKLIKLTGNVTNEISI